MKKICVELKNCYGIKALDYNFDFEHSNIYSIYAPNWVMKSSFAKTFQILQLDWKENPCDKMFPERKPKYDIFIDETKKQISPENIFVVSHVEKYLDFKNTETLLLKQSSKDKYQKQIEKIIESENVFLSQLSKLMKWYNSDKIKDVLLESFNKKDLFEVMKFINVSVNNGKDEIFDDEDFYKLFNEKSYKFINDHQKLIKKYIDVINDWFEAAEYLSSDFNHYRAEKVNDEVWKRKFFEWTHKIALYNSKDQKYDYISSKEEFKEKIDKEAEKIFGSPEAKKELQKINGAIKNADLEDLRDYLLTRENILIKLWQVDLFRREVLVDKIKKINSTYHEYYDKIIAWEKNIQIILDEAKKDRDLWDSSIAEFNNRFLDLPFELEVQNFDEILTKQKEPKIIFNFKDRETFEKTKEVSENDLKEVLSGWEKRALYLLNIIFEIKARQVDENETLLIIDDIADSFDYKNKYAIVEYLKDLSEELDLFKMIILTHNFDFFRTINSRLNIQKKEYKEDKDWNILKDIKSKRLLASRGEKNIILEEFKFDGDPFKIWKKELTEKNIIALIPFVRNLIEYWKNFPNEKLLLTHLLHIKENECMYNEKGFLTKKCRATDFSIKDSYSILFQDIEKLYIEYLGILWFDSWISVKNIFISLEMIISWIIWEKPLNPCLENKIIFAIAIRLEAEKYMLSILVNQISDEELNEVFFNQTRILFSKIKSEWKCSNDNLKILDRVNVMTPENIHLNSFMYEPILDMDIIELKKLYEDVKKLSIEE